MSPRPELLGIVNITEDSFSDGGRFLERSSLESRIKELCQSGCKILDLGAASSNPAANPVEPATEIQRLELAFNIIDTLRNRDEIPQNVQVSVDSFKSEVQSFALERNVDFLNDITGFSESSFYPTLLNSKSQLILMHSIQEGIATDVRVSPDSILDRIATFFRKRLTQLENAGIARSRIILDPGMGFFLGSDPECSYRVLRNLGFLRKEFDLPLLISVSRKSFLGALVNKPPLDRAAATLSCELYLADQKVEYIRTHDPAALMDALIIQNALRS